MFTLISETSGNNEQLPHSEKIPTTDWIYIIKSIIAFGPIVALLIAIVGYFCLPKNRHTPRIRARPQGTEDLPHTSNLPEAKEPQLEVLITLDTTPARGGAIFKVPSECLIFHYSVNWSEHYKFTSDPEEPDKFEMLNTLIALEVYRKEISVLCEGKRIILKTYSNFPIVNKPRRNSSKPGQWMFENILYSLKKIGEDYEIRHVTRQDSRDKKGAALLCRGQIQEYNSLYHMHYSKDDLSLAASRAMVSIKYFVPEEYVK